MKKGFTLAEVLITLGIIGVVAALTLPALVHKYTYNLTEARLKKFYSVFNQAILMSKNVNGDFEGWDGFWYSSEDTPNLDGIDKGYEKYILPYMKVVSHKVLTAANGPKLNVYFFADGSAFSVNSNITSDIRFYPNNPERCISTQKKYGICSFSFVFYPLFDKGYYEKWQYHYKKGLEPMLYNWDGLEEHLYSGAPENRSCDAQGQYCTAIIARNGWKIPDDYPKKIRY